MKANHNFLISEGLPTEIEFSITLTESKNTFIIHANLLNVWEVPLNRTMVVLRFFAFCQRGTQYMVSDTWFVAKHGL